MKQRFLEQLEQDIAQNRQAAEAWDDLAKFGAQLQGIDGKPIATAEQMAAGFRAKEKELRDLISQMID